MTTPETPVPPGSRLLWALRFHARPLTVAAFVTLCLTSVAVGRLVLGPPAYTATAAVIATEVEFSTERVSRLAEAIYQQDSTLADAIRRGDLPWTIDVLRDERATVTPLEDNILVNVEGRSSSPQLAVRTANSVAEALSAALQRSGADATFSVQERASRAVRDDLLVPVAVTVVAGLVGTAAVVLGVASLLLAVRRPLTRPSEAAQATGTRVLTVVDVPRHGVPVIPLRGVEALRRALAQKGTRTVVLTTTPDGGPLRSAVADSYAQLVAVEPETRPVERATVLDGFDDEQAAWRESLPPGAAGVLVVPEGARRQDALAVIERFVPDDLAGLVFVTRAGSGRRRRRRARDRETPQRRGEQRDEVLPTPSHDAPVAPAPDAREQRAVGWPGD